MYPSVCTYLSLKLKWNPRPLRLSINNAFGIGSDHTSTYQLLSCRYLVPERPVICSRIALSYTSSVK